MKLSKEAREAKNRYLREWRKKNPEKVKASMIRFWEKKAAESNPPFFKHIMKLHEQGWAAKEIAARLEISEVEVTKIIQNYYW
jgi:DNA-binding NarL/FixJ family response regulator